MVEQASEEAERADAQVWAKRLSGDTDATAKPRPNRRNNDAGERKVSRNQRSAKHVPHYNDLHEELILVNKALLREISNASFLQEGLGAAGMFFLSGSFWLSVTLWAEHHTEKTFWLDYAPWLAVCAISVIFGAILICVAVVHYVEKNQRISEAFSAGGHGDA